MAEIIYSIQLKLFIWRGSFEERVIPRQAGWKFRTLRFPSGRGCINAWFTSSLEKALKLEKYMSISSDILECLKKEAAKTRKAIEESRAAETDLFVPAPRGLQYRDYQKAGIAYALKRKNTLIGDEMGLGKTIQAIGFINARDDINKVLVICPASAKLNWWREIIKWVIRNRQVTIIKGRSDSWPITSIIIMNYDVLSAYSKPINTTKFDLLIVDEAQYLKNPKAKRTKAVLKIQARHKLALTGTPFLNRPEEIWPILKWFDPQKWGSFHKFGLRYCGAYHNGYGWDYKGASNTEELQKELRSTFMIRRLKKDVLPELPRKERQLVELETPDGLFALPKKLWKKVCGINTRAFTGNYEKSIEKLFLEEDISFEEMSEIRKAIGLKKAPLAINFIEEALKSSHKIVCFAHHAEVLKTLKTALNAKKKRAVLVSGATRLGERQKNIDAFQNDPAVRVFLGNIQAAGTAITLTAASHIIFVEYDWVPGRLIQAEDRCHRIGQEKSVLIQYLVLNNTIDAAMAKVVLSKQKIAEEVLDKKLEIEG